MGVGLVGHAVELQVGHVEAGLLRLRREVRLQGEAQAVGGRLHHLVADLLRVPAGGQEVRGERRLPARELHRHLPPRLEGDGVVQDLLDLLHGQLVDVADLVRVHEAGAAHHVAAVGEVDGEHRPAAVLDGGRAVAVDQLVAHGREVAPREPALDAPRELRVDRDEVLERAVLGARLAHADLVVLLVERGLDLPEVAAHEVGDVALAAQDLARASPSRSAGRANRSRAGSPAGAGSAGGT